MLNQGNLPQPSPEPRSISSEGQVFDIKIEALPARPELQGRHEQWHQIERHTSRIVDGLGKPIDQNIFTTVVGLNALNFPTSWSCEGHVERGEPSPMVTIQTPEPRLAMWYNGQDKTFRALLRDIPIPVKLRLENPWALGLSRYLTPENIEAIDSPSFRVEYSQMHDEIWEAMRQSRAATGHKPGSPELNYCPEELARQEANTALLARASKLVGEFNSNREDPDHLKVYIKTYGDGVGHPFELIAGRHVNREIRDADCLQQRQTVISEFASFLKERFLLGSAA